MTARANGNGQPNTPEFRRLAKLAGFHQTGVDQWQACCPAHADHDPSLSITIGTGKKKGRPVFDCLAGCDYEEINAALNKATLTKAFDIGS
jgi:hypothetical protein